MLSRAKRRALGWPFIGFSIYSDRSLFAKAKREWSPWLSKCRWILKIAVSEKNDTYEKPEERKFRNGVDLPSNHAIDYRVVPFRFWPCRATQTALP